MSDSRTEVSRSGEESRFLKQLEMLYGFEIHRWNMKDPGQSEGMEDVAPLSKTQEHVDKMHSERFRLSATALKMYLNCQAQFFYSYIEGLSVPDEVAESLDAGMIGTVTHSVIEELYAEQPFDKDRPRPLGKITAEYLQGLLAKDDRRIIDLTEKYIREQMSGSDVRGKNILWRDLIVRYVRDIVKADLNLAGSRGWFECLGLELPKSATIGGFRFFGKIDRVDSPEEGVVRIVDYKTGNVQDSDVNVTAAVVDELFGDDNANRPTIALQLYVYDLLMRGDERCKGKLLQNCIYQTTSIAKRGAFVYNPDPEFEELMETKMAELLKELDTPEGEWLRTGDEATCEKCDFKILCGR